jgi:hypothetical protein
MPYNNEYNRKVARDLNQSDWRFATLFNYSPVDGRGRPCQMDGGSNAGVLFQMGNASKRDAEDNIVNDNVSKTLPPVYYYGNSSEGMNGGSGFAEGTFRDTGMGSQLGVASGMYDKSGSGMSGGEVERIIGGNLWSDLYDGFSDLGSDIGKAVDYVVGSGKPEKEKAKMLGRLLAHAMKMKGMGMSGGSWWDSLKEGVSDVVGIVPNLLLHGLGESGGAKKRGRPKKVGGAILGNPDPYPVKGDSERVAGRGRGRPKKVGGAMVDAKQNSLLAMPSVVLANGVPPKAQLRGSYGGAKPKKSKAEETVMKAVAKKLGKGKISKKEHDALQSVLDKHPVGGQNLSGMTDKRGQMKPVGGKNLSGMTDKTGKGKSGGADGRKKRAEIVKKIMKEKGMKMIEASKYVKEHKLY